MMIKKNVAIVTGGASGLGEAVVRMIVKNGGKAAILDSDERLGNEIADSLGSDVFFIKTDVTEEISVKAAIEKCGAHFHSISFAINCAGVATPEKVFSKKGLINMNTFNRVVMINLSGTMNVIVYSAKAMTLNTPNDDGEKGVVVNTASIAAFEGQVGQAAYAASKAGVVGLTLPLAREFAEYGIRVVTVAPGLFNTPMMAGLPEKARKALDAINPFPKRLGYPDEFAFLVKHIIENPLLNGETIRLDSALRMAAK